MQKQYHQKYLGRVTVLGWNEKKQQDDSEQCAETSVKKLKTLNSLKSVMRITEEVKKACKKKGSFEIFKVGLPKAEKKKKIQVHTM